MKLRNGERASMLGGGVSQPLVPKHLSNVAEQRSGKDKPSS